ncbi:RNA polymerase subunit sigma-24 [Burkholderia humptydooensis]|nr:RNA polymerase subunit sigma-24 [Burkholderia humptydooensis]
MPRGETLHDRRHDAIAIAAAELEYVVLDEFDLACERFARKWRLRTVASGMPRQRAVSSTLSSSTERSTNTIRNACGNCSSCRSSRPRSSARAAA